MKVTLHTGSSGEHWTLDVPFVDIELNGRFVNTVYNSHRDTHVEFVVNHLEARMEHGHLVINSLFPRWER